MAEVKDVLADRESKYGDFFELSKIASNIREVIAGAAQGSGVKLAADQTEALHMICSKIARILNGDPNHADSWIDIAGYATLVANRLEGKT